MGGFGWFDILIVGGIAVFLFLRLRSVLGQRTEDDDNRQANNARRMQEQLEARQQKQEARERRDREKAARQAGENVIPLQPENDGAQNNQPEPQKVRVARPIEDQARDIDPERGALHDAIIAIGGRDNSFDPRGFVSGAKMAYEMIVTAFARGDQDALESLLAADVMEGFRSVIENRAEQGQTAEVEVIGIRDAKIVGAVLDGDLADVTVKFRSEMISVTRDAEGDVVDGKPDTVQDVQDVWTFQRDLTSDDPNWLLISTAANG